MSASRTARTAHTARHRRLLAGLAVTPLALGLVACGSDEDSDDASAPSETVTVTSEPSSDPSASTGGTGGASGGSGDEAGLLAAAETALGEVDGTVVTVDRDDNGWDVTIVAADGTERDLDLSSDGSTVERGPDSDDDDADDRREQQRLVQGAQLDYLAAIEAARGQSGGGTLVGVDLDEDDGRVEWDVDFRGAGSDETTVTVDAASGQVIGTDRDRDDDGDDNGDDNGDD